MFISTTTLTSSPSDLTAVGQKQEACSSIGLLARQSPSDRPLTTPSSTTLSMAIRQPNWSEADTLLRGKTVESPASSVESQQYSSPMGYMGEQVPSVRSEERRVGKEGRCGGATDH